MTQPDAIAQDESPDDDENAEETELFDRIVSDAVSDEDLVVIIDEYELTERLPQNIQAERRAIWGQVRAQRSRWRAAVETLKQVSDAVLPEYEEAIRKSRPDLVAGQADLERARAGLQVREAQVQKAAEDLQLARQRDQAALESRRHRAMVERVEESIRLAEEAIANPGKAASVPAGHKGLYGLLRKARKPGSPPGKNAQPDSAAKSGDELAQRYYDARRSLNDIRMEIARLDLMRNQVNGTIQMNARRAAAENPALRDADAEVTSARATLEEALTGAIRQAVRAFLNTYATQTFNVHMRVREAGGLYESLSGNVIATAKIDQLYESVCRMNGVSFGLAGPRGSGKSTAIQYLHDKLNSAGGGSPGPAPSRERAGRPGDYGDPGEGGSTGRSRHSSPAPRFFAVVVSAPVSYISRDFILHVFAELCRAIAGPHADELIAPVPSDDKEASSGKRHLIQPIANVVLLAAGAVAAAAATALDPAIARASVPLLAASGAGMAGFVTIMSRPNSRPSRISVRQDWERRRDFLLAIWGAIASSCIAVVGTELHLRLLGRVLWDSRHMPVRDKRSRAARVGRR